jgi:hypothetical protein
MNKLTASLSLSAALMLGVANFSAPVAFAQEKDEKGSSMKESSQDKGPSRAQESNQSKSDAPDRGDKGEPSKAKSSDNRGDTEKSKSASEQRDRGDKAGSEKSASDKDSSKEKSAGRQDEKSSNKQSETKADQPAAKKADKAETAPAKKSDDTADSKKPDDNNRSAGKANDEPNRSAGADTAKTEKAKTADLSGDKKERVKTSFKSENVKKITNVNVDISVGRRLPRDWEYHSVPTAVIEIVPEYRGYRYAYVEDRYVIVDPNTYEVVYVIDDNGGSGSASVGRSTGESGSARCSSDLTFSQEDRTFIFEKVRTHSASVKIGNLEIGTTLPQDSRVEVFPSEVTTRVSKLDSCRYVVVDDKVAVVDPSDDRIVAIIED